MVAGLLEGVVWCAQIANRHTAAGFTMTYKAGVDDLSIGPVYLLYRTWHTRFTGRMRRVEAW